MQSDYYWEDEEQELEPRQGGRFWIVLFLFLSLMICVSGAVIVPGGLGFLAGYDQLQAQNHENAIQHFQRGLGYLAENYPELAYSEFEIAVRFDPAYEPAAQRVQEMQGTVGGPGAAGVQEEDRVAAALFGEASDLATGGQWEDAVNRLEQIRALNTTFRTQDVNDLLYRAYVEAGKAAVVANQIELARERFDAALTIRNTDPEVTRQRDLAALYLDGQQAVGYNWQTAIAKFERLYQQDPNYDDIKKRLVDAYTQYGDAAAKQSAWCLAAREYDSAQAIASDPQTAAKRTQTMGMCRQAIAVTPTPAPATGSEIFVSKISVDASRPCGTSGDVSGTVRDAFQQPLAGFGVAYYADGINRVTTRTGASGQYQFTWGMDPGVFHIIIVGADGKTQIGVAADVQYPGASRPGCHIIVDWQRVQ